MSQTPAEIIDAKGGPAAFAAAIGYVPGAVRMMKHRNHIPRTAWPEVLRAFPDLTLEVLLAAQAKAAAQKRATFA
jgi:hypothetical protein